MTCLALEFSTERRSVAVAVDGRLVAEVVHQGMQRTPLFSLIQKSLVEAGVERSQVECLSVGLGPGSYTGVRMSISVAQGWQLAVGVSTVGYSSLEALAEESKGLIGRVLLAIDAQRGEFVSAPAEKGRLLGPMELLSAETLRRRATEGWTIAGPEIGSIIAGAVPLFPRAATLALAAPGLAPVPAETLVPIYLREANFVKAPPPRAIPPLPGNLT